MGSTFFGPPPAPHRADASRVASRRFPLGSAGTIRTRALRRAGSQERSAINVGFTATSTRQPSGLLRPRQGLENEDLDREVGVDVVVAHEADDLAAGQLLDRG